jgi:hypothetical protein
VGIFVFLVGNIKNNRSKAVREINFLNSFDVSILKMNLKSKINIILIYF